jgi:hypothetical protein
MAVSETREPQRGSTFEDFWAGLMEIREIQRETARQMQETDRKIKESQEKTDHLIQETDHLIQETGRQMQETDQKIKESQEKTDQLIQETALHIKALQEETAQQMKETDRKMKETDRQISKLGNRIGELVEKLTTPNVMEQFTELGYHFTRISQNIKIKGPDKQILTEIDLLLENGDYVMVVEVKTLLDDGDVQAHLTRMDTIRRYADTQQDGRKYLGAVSGAIINNGMKELALKRGLYVIEHPGEMIRIVPPPEVRIW